MDGIIENVTALLHTHASEPGYLELLRRVAEWVEVELTRVGEMEEVAG